MSHPVGVEPEHRPQRRTAVRVRSPDPDGLSHTSTRAGVSRRSTLAADPGLPRAWYPGSGANRVQSADAASRVVHIGQCPWLKVAAGEDRADAARLAGALTRGLAGRVPVVDAVVLRRLIYGQQVPGYDGKPRTASLGRSGSRPDRRGGGGTAAAGVLRPARAATSARRRAGASENRRASIGVPRSTRPTAGDRQRGCGRVRRGNRALRVCGLRG